MKKAFVGVAVLNMFMGFVTAAGIMFLLQHFGIFDMLNRLIDKI